MYYMVKLYYVFFCIVVIVGVFLVEEVGFIDFSFKGLRFFFFFDLVFIVLIFLIYVLFI